MRYFDLHCDTLYRAYINDMQLYKNDYHIDLNKAKKYNEYYQCFAVWLTEPPKNKTYKQLFNGCLAKFKGEVKKYESDFFHPILTVEDGVIVETLEDLDYLDSNGVKIITLTWNGENKIGGGANTDAGLKPFGAKVIKKMNDLGIVVDLSHASDRLFYDIISLFPDLRVVATHSNSRSICNHKRNLTDEQFKIIAKNGGVVGLNFCQYFLSEENASFADVVSHAEHFLSLGGEDAISIGSDFDGTDVVNPIKSIEDIEMLAEYFLKHNYPEGLVDKIFFKNAYNFYSKI
jgi:membrane dipeptidase